MVDEILFCFNAVLITLLAIFAGTAIAGHAIREVYRAKTKYVTDMVAATAKSGNVCDLRNQQ